MLAGASLVVRYRRAGTTERLQIKWVAYVGVGMAVVFPIAALQIDGISDVAFLIGFTLVAALPLAVAFAVLRYRLLEIDRLISRTFVYGALTAILAGLYAASLRLFNGLFVAFTGNESDAALVLTTLVLASTLTPMKLRLEGFASRHLTGERDAPVPASVSATRVGPGRRLATPALARRPGRCGGPRGTRRTGRAAARSAGRAEPSRCDRVTIADRMAHYAAGAPPGNTPREYARRHARIGAWSTSSRVSPASR